MGILHRDIKPSNLLLDVRGNLWVTDFGLARIDVGPGVTMTGDVVGTVRYMSPEQASPQKYLVDHRTDIYSLGTTLYELLTLQPAFPGRDRDEVLRQIASEDAPAPRQLNKGIPVELETIVLKAMAKDPAERYSTSQTFAQDLVRYLEDKPIHARRPTFAQRIREWRRRHRSLVTTVSVALVTLLVVVAVGTTYSAIQINRAKSEAVQLTSSVYTEQGAHLADQGDLLRALAWHAGALRLDQGNRARTADHRVRLATTLRSCPKLIHVWLDIDCNGITSISADGERVASVHSDGTVQIWNVGTGQLTTTLKHQGRVNHVRFCPTGSWIVTASDDRTARVWDGATGQPIGPPIVHSHGVVHADFGPSGQEIVTSASDGSVRIWNPVTGKSVGPPIDHEGDGRGQLRSSFSPDGNHILTVSQFNTVRIWNRVTGEPCTPYLHHDKHLSGARFDLSGQRVITVCNDKSVRSWDAIRGQLVNQMSLSDEAQVDVSIGVFSPDCRHLLSIHLDGTARMIDLSTGSEISGILRDATGIGNASISPDGCRIATVNHRGDLWLWNLAAGHAIQPSLRLRGFVRDISFTDSGKTVALTTFGNHARLWDLDNGNALTKPLVFDDSRGSGLADAGARSVHTAALSPDGRVVVTTDTGRLAYLWDATTGVPLCPPLVHDQNVLHASFSRDSQMVATASGTGDGRNTAGEVRLWDTQTGQLRETMSHRGRPDRVALGPDGGVVCTTGGAYLEAVVWNSDLERAVVHRPHGSRIWCVDWSPDGRSVVTASDDQTARLWDVATGESVVPPLVHGDAVRCASFSRDGRFVATGCSDGGARVWDAATGQAITPPLYHDMAVRGVWFSSDSQNLYTATSDGRVRIWDLSADDRPTDDLVRYAELLAGHTVGTTGGLVPMSVDRLGEEFQSLRSTYPNRFASSPQDKLLWHRRQADDCARDQHWLAAIWHLDRLIGLDHSSPNGYALRGRANSALKQWDQASADFAEAIKLGQNGQATRLERGRILILAGTDTIVPQNSPWKWLHRADGSDPNNASDGFHTAFFLKDFDDRAWQTGNDSPGTEGGFGYGDRVGIDIGKPASGNRKTAYFRHKFTSDDAHVDLFLSMRSDDGVIIYLDGAEVARDNMGPGKEAHDLSALNNTGHGEDALRHIPLPGVLRAGEHVLAISLHNHSIWSSDLRIGQISLLGLSQANPGWIILIDA